MYALLKLGIIECKSIIFLHSIDLNFFKKIAISSVMVIFVDKYLLTTDAIDEHDDISLTQEEEKENVGEEYDINETDDTLLKEIEKETKALADMHLTIKTGADVDNPSTKSKTAHDHTINMASNNEVMPHRGIDFRGVTAVINFSCPLTLKKYIHRIGRTARQFQ
ncbi:hypothetical protein RFI_26383 [Reticulomyxa filosa]|uniref:Helicase C-terminal domain-containing protein n=1 Tax=Reticulomyxa filosa TaxID=46433 RepID=X6MAG7_RETFI|nr:hypothetical protein RFI_26383 [Reticulomyxa filosa]|eukprot:ETO10993.1 hypothetical protein RFI_26383 [Reticulomyxa filosa]